MEHDEIIARFRDAAELLDRGTPPVEVADYLRATARRIEAQADDGPIAAI
jgi:hypothetical protein